MRDPRQYFTLTRGSTADKAILYVRDNGAKDGFIPNQRLWIALPGGDVLLRRLVAVGRERWGNWRCISVPNSA